MCETLGVSWSGFHAWLNRSPSRRAREDEVLLAGIRTSFAGSDRTYGARRVWHDVLADGLDAGLHRIERLGKLFHRGSGLMVVCALEQPSLRIVHATWDAAQRRAASSTA